MNATNRGLTDLLEPLTTAAALSRFRDRTHKFELVERDSWFFYVLKDDWFVSTIKPGDRNLDIAVLERRLAKNPAGHEAPEPSDTDKFLAGFAESVPNLTYLDIGGNYGQTAVRIDKLLRSTGVDYQIESFEPGVAADCMAVNLALNGCENVRLFDTAFSSIDSFIPIFAMDGHSEDNKIVNAAEHATVFPVRSVTLDTAASVMQDAFRDGLTFTKIDTQGAEVEVLRGASGLIKDQQLLAFSEFSPLAISSRLKPAVWLADLQQNMHIVVCDARQNFQGRLGRSNDEIQTFVDEISTSASKFCDLLLISHDHPKIDLIAAVLSDLGVSLEQPGPLTTS